MLPEEPEFSRYRAALVEFNLEGAVSGRTICLARDSLGLHEAVSRFILEQSEVLMDYYWEHINCSELDVLHESYGEGDYPEDGWSVDDVRKLLPRLVREHGEYLQQEPATAKAFGPWYKVVEWLNDVYDPDDGVWVPIEGTLPAFTKELLVYEASGCDPTRIPAPRESMWEETFLGRLAVFAALEDRQWRPVEVYRAFFSLIREFNERYKCS